MNRSHSTTLSPPAGRRATAAGAYLEFPSRARAILCTWTLQVGKDQPRFSQRVIPDGCVDVVWLGGEEIHVAGPATRPVDVSIPAGTTVVGIRLRPGAARSVFRERQPELLNQLLPLREMFPHMADRLLGALSAAQTPEKARAILERKFAGRAEEQKVDDLMLAAVAQIAGATDLSVVDLAARIGLSERQLRRRFEDAVGYGPKTFHRVMRLQRLCAALRSTHARPDLCAVALAMGYADQAHMTRECRELAGHSPRELGASTVRLTLGMADFFKTPALSSATLRPSHENPIHFEHGGRQLRCGRQRETVSSHAWPPAGASSDRHDLSLQRKD